MKKIDGIEVAFDCLWLILMMISIYVDNRNDDIQGLIYIISLMIWYIGARILFSSWKD